jgi:methyl-accepting chemotaxis protein
MKLQSATLVPILSVLILSLVLICITSVSVMRDSTNTIVMSEMKNIADLANHQIKQSGEITNSVLDMMNNKNIAIAQALAVIIAKDPSSLQDKNMARLRDLFEVAEVHVTDENGILNWGSETSFFGLDFYTNDQTRPLTAIIDNPSLTIAQEPQPRAVDGTLFQYISVSRIDQPGIVQVGVEMKTIDSIKLTMNVQNAIKDIKIGVGGGVFLMNSDRQVVADNTHTLLGINLADEPWVDAMFSLKEGYLKYHYNNNGYEAYCRLENDYMIVTYVPLSEMNGYATKILNSIIPLGIVSTLVVSIISIWLIQ